MKPYLNKIIRTSRRILFITISIAISLAVILYFRWGGLKGLLGFAVGVLITGYMFMTENLYIRAFMDYMLQDDKEKRK